MNTVTASIGDGYRDINHFFGQWIKSRGSYHDRFDFTPCALEQVRVKCKIAPHIVDKIGLTGLSDVVKHSLDARMVFYIFRNRKCAHRDPFEKYKLWFVMLANEYLQSGQHWDTDRMDGNW
jgi:hypothetical protein